MIRFTKMQGAGNDFVIIDAIKQNFAPDPHTIRKIADRHFGIGCDQVLLITLPKDHHVDFCYRIFNADGGEAEQSGNGARCVAKYAYLHGIVISHNIVMQTPSRIVKATINNNEQVTVDMGAAEFTPVKIPFLAEKQALNYHLTTSLGDFVIGAVSFGNPHAVIKVTDLETTDVTNIGAALSKHSMFPKGANINFMQIIDESRINLRTYERGSGETLACGSGSCAAVVISRLWQLLDKQVTVCLQGGNLVVNCPDITLPISITGAAEISYTGEWDN